MATVRASALAIVLTLGILLMLPSLPASAATLAGRVVDAETGEALAGASVMIPGEENIGTESGDTGAFILDGAPADQPFMLVVTSLGYEALIQLQDPAAPGRDELLIELEPTFYRGEKIVISASRYSSDVHLSQSNITGEQLAKRRTEKDIPHLLEIVPGVHASSDAGNGVGYTYLKLRGFDQKRVGVMVNGVPLNDPEDHQVYWVDLPDLASSVEDVQVQRGISNSLGGMSAIGGTVNLVTKRLGDEPGGRAAFSFGSYNTFKRSLGYETGLVGGGRFAAAMRLSQVQSDGYRDRSGSEQWSVFWSGRYLTPNSKTQVNIYTGHEISHFAWEAIDEATLAANRTWNPDSYENAIDDFRQPHYELHQRWKLGERTLLHNSVYFIQGDGFYENFKAGRDPVDFGLDTAFGIADSLEANLVRRKTVKKRQLGMVSRLTVEHGRGHLVLGGDIYDFHSRHHGTVLSVDVVDPEGDAFPNYDIGPGDLLGLPDYYAYTGDKLVWSIYANEKFELGGGFTALLDLHFQHKSYDFMQEETGNFRGDNRHAYRVEHDFFNPKGGLYWQAPDGLFGGELGVYAHVGLAHREPSDGELFDTWYGPDDLGASPLFADSRAVMSGGAIDYIEWSSPLVEEEKVLDYELGFSWRSEALSFSLGAYRMDFENEIVSSGAVNDDNEPIRGNADRTLHQGIELGLTARLDARHLLQLAFSRSWDEYSELTQHEWGGGETDLSGNPLALFPEYLFNVMLEGDYEGAGVFIQARGAGKQYLDNSGDEDRTIDSYVSLDLGGSLDLARLGLEGVSGLSIEGRLNNALNEEYETSGWFDPWFDDDGANFYIPAATRHFMLGVSYEF